MSLFSNGSQAELYNHDWSEFMVSVKQNFLTNRPSSDAISFYGSIRLIADSSLKKEELFSAKIEVHSVETGSIIIFVGWQSWTYDLVVTGFMFPNFSFST